MIAIGGAIGTGLFLGAGGRLNAAGPSLVIAYAVCGFFAFLILRALGELVLHRPSSGSFVSYAREFFGEKAAFVSGWFYWINWATTTIVDITAAALYMNFFGNYIPWMAAVPQWAWALIALRGGPGPEPRLRQGLRRNGILVRPDQGRGPGHLPRSSAPTSSSSAPPWTASRSASASSSDNGGIFPNGLLPMIILMQGVLFAYASIELVGTAAGETENPEKIMPKAINSVVFRIAVFYVGSVILLALLLPYTSYEKGVSPFVTFFGSIGIQGVDVIMNLVVLTAALSSLNAGLYSTGRILRSMSVNGSAPKFASADEQSRRPLRRHRHHRRRLPPRRPAELPRPRPGLRNRPERRLRRHHHDLGHHRALPDPAQTLGRQRLARTALLPDVRRPLHRLPLPALPRRRPDHGLHRLPPHHAGHRSSPRVLMVAGWYACRNRIHEIAEARDGYTGSAPVIANPPAATFKK